MPRIPKSDIRRFVENIDLAELVGKHTKLDKSGREWKGCCPFHEEKTASFHVVPHKHFYHCFGCGAHGNAISFIETIKGLDFLGALRDLGFDLADDPTRGPAPASRSLEPKPFQKKPAIPDPVDLWKPVLPVPVHAKPLMAEPGMTEMLFNPKRAGTNKAITRLKPVRVDPYMDAKGQLLGYVIRVDFTDGGKLTPTITWCRGPSGVEGWAMIPFPDPRPLQGLDELAKRPDAPVIVVEGEKAREAARELCPESVVLAWPNGANGITHVDWSPLAGRDVTLWPDADLAGIRSMNGYTDDHGDYHAGVSDYLRPIVRSIAMIDPTGQEKGWDADDARKAGWDADKTEEWLKARTSLLYQMVNSGPLPKSITDSFAELFV